MNMTKQFATLAIAALAAVTGCQQVTKEHPMQSFVDAHVAKIKPMEKAVNLAAWTAENTGKDADFDRVSALQLELEKVYANPDEFGETRSNRHCSNRSSNSATKSPRNSTPTAAESTDVRLPTTKSRRY